MRHPIAFGSREFRRTALVGLALAGAGFLSACGGGPRKNTLAGNRTTTGTAAPAAAPVPAESAVAQLNPTEGSRVDGTVTFLAVEGGVRVLADVQGLTEGDHGFAIDRYGDCSADDGSSAGGPFDPDHSPHGAPASPPSERQVGDLGNLHAGPDGKAHYDRIDRELAFSGPHSILGRGVVVHEGADDLHSQPSGNDGPRVACGVIGRMETRPAGSGVAPGTEPSAGQEPAEVSS